VEYFFPIDQMEFKYLCIKIVKNDSLIVYYKDITHFTPLWCNSSTVLANNI